MSGVPLLDWWRLCLGPDRRHCGCLSPPWSCNQACDLSCNYYHAMRTAGAMPSRFIKCSLTFVIKLARPFGNGREFFLVPSFLWLSQKCLHAPELSLTVRSDQLKVSRAVLSQYVINKGFAATSLRWVDRSSTCWATTRLSILEVLHRGALLQVESAVQGLTIAWRQ